MAEACLEQEVPHGTPEKVVPRKDLDMSDRQAMQEDSMGWGKLAELGISCLATVYSTLSPQFR